MDLLSVIGYIGGTAVIIIGISMLAPLTQYWDPASVFITVGGTAGALLIAFPSYIAKNFLTLIKLTIFPQKYDPVSTISTLVTFAEKARKEGLLSLEDEVEELDDEFMKSGLRLVVDGSDAEVIKSVLTTRLNTLEQRHQDNIDFFSMGGSLAPAFGMIGTLIGLINMLLHLDNPEMLGPSMGTALITTLYGAILANLYFNPIAKKLEKRHNEEVLIREIMIEGILSIQKGDSPRILEDKLMAFLPPKVKEELEERRREGVTAGF